MSLSGIFLGVLLFAALAPKVTRAVVAALVQIVPGATTHVGQNESRLISLDCLHGENFCRSVDSSGNIGGGAYQVPTGFTLVVTDYDFLANLPSGDAGTMFCDGFFNNSNSLNFQGNGSCGVADKDGRIFRIEHYTTGIRVGSGVTIADSFASDGIANASLQGYLVPND